jgi:hypothetical protein
MFLFEMLNRNLIAPHLLGYKFESFKKIASEMKISPNKVERVAAEKLEMVSFHSISKGFLGECGIRGGYVPDSRVPVCVRGSAATSGGNHGSSLLVSQEFIFFRACVLLILFELAIARATCEICVDFDDSRFALFL